MANTLPIEAIQALRNKTINNNAKLALEFYEFMVRVSDARWTGHFKRFSHDWHSSVIIKEDFDLALLDFMLSRKPRYLLTPNGKVCDITQHAEYVSPPLAYWTYCRKVPCIITLLTARYVGVDYIGDYTLDVAVNIPKVNELHAATVWLRKRFAYDGVDLYSPYISMNYMNELLAYLRPSKLPHVAQRRQQAAEDALHVLCNRFPEHFGNSNNRGL